MITFLTRKNLWIICLLLAFLSASFPIIADDKEDAKQIVFIRYNLKDTSSPPSEAVNAFKTTMAERGYEEGKNVAYVDHVTHFPERKSAGEILDIVDKYLPTADMFITTGWTSLYVRSKLAKSDVPQLFVPALKSTALNMLPSIDTQPGTNLSGIYLMYPPEKILRITKNVLPNTTKYGFVYDSRIPADIMFKAAYGQLNVHERYGITIYYLDLATGTDTVLQKIDKMGIEVFGGVVGLLKNLSEFSDHNIPIITVLLFDRDDASLIKTIRDTNIIAGLYNPFEYCGKEAAQMTADIFDGKTTIDQMIPRPAQQIALVNLLAAKRLKQSIPFSALEGADLVIK